MGGSKLRGNWVRGVGGECKFGDIEKDRRLGGRRKLIV
jgi:hypothetical protein